MLATMNVLTTTLQTTTPIITWSNPADIVYGTPLSNVQLDASASEPGTFAYIPSTGTVLNVDPQLLNVLFIPTDTADYNIASKTVTIKVTAHDSKLYPYPGNLYPYIASLGNSYLWHLTTDGANKNSH
jgi:hypothetical protein